MADSERPNRLFTRRLWAFALVQMTAGAVLVLTGPMWVGLLLVVLPMFGLLPLILEDRRRRRT